MFHVRFLTIIEKIFGATWGAYSAPQNPYLKVFPCYARNDPLTSKPVSPTLAKIKEF